MVNFQLQFVEKTPKQNDLYKVIGLEEEVGELELVIWDKEKFLEERPNHRNTVSEESQYKFEVLTERLRCVWHTPQEVVDYFYYQKYKKNKTTKAMFNDIKNSLAEIEESAENLAKEVEEIGEISASIEEIIHQEERDRSRILYEKDGIKITEYDIKRISENYFEGTDLEEIRFQWKEILNSSDICDLISRFDSPNNPFKESAKVKEVLQQLKENVQINTIPLAFDAFKIIIKSGVQIQNFSEKKNRKFHKETKLRNWILEEDIKNIRKNKLKESIENDPKLIAMSYKIDIGEEVPLLYVATHNFNNRFGVSWSPLQVFTFVTTGLFGIVFLGYWFLSRVKSWVRSRNINSNHQD